MGEAEGRTQEAESRDQEDRAVLLEDRGHGYTRDAEGQQQ
jgi:hypothetical protein